MQSNVLATLDIAPLITVAKQTDLTSLKIAALAVCKIFFEFLSRALIDPATLTFDLEVGVGVPCVLGYLCAKFRLTQPFRFRFRPVYATDGQTDRHTDRRQTPIIA